jgi:hypothetical protein
MCASRVLRVFLHATVACDTEILMCEGHQELCGYALYKSLLTYVAHMDLVGDPLQCTCHARASEILNSKVCKISTYDFVGSLRSMWRQRTWIFEPSQVVRLQDRVMTDKLVIPYSSVWP